MARKKSESVRVTSIEVAKKAGVSQATVSRVFSNEPTVTERTKERVMEAAKELGYTPNMIARSLSSHRTNIIAVVLSDVRNPFYTAVFAELACRLQEKNKQILFFEMQTEQDIGQIISRVLEYQVDGLVITAPALPADLAEECVRVQVPVVLFNRYTTNKNLCAVCSDNVEAGRMVANYLLDKNYTQFAYIGGHETSTGKDRRKGFVDRLKERGIAQCVLESGEYSYNCGRDAMLRLFSRKNPPNAVFCANDSIAMGALDAARQLLALNVPEDVGIVGFDNVDSSSWACFSLTTVRQPLEEMVNEVCKYLCNTSEDIEGGLQLMKCELVERGTA